MHAFHHLELYFCEDIRSLARKLLKKHKKYGNFYLIFFLCLVACYYPMSIQLKINEREAIAVYYVNQYGLNCCPLINKF